MNIACWAVSIEKNTEIAAPLTDEVHLPVWTVLIDWLKMYYKNVLQKIMMLHKIESINRYLNEKH